MVFIFSSYPFAIGEGMSVIRTLMSDSVTGIEP